MYVYTNGKWIFPTLDKSFILKEFSMFIIFLLAKSVFIEGAKSVFIEGECTLRISVYLPLLLF